MNAARAIPGAPDGPSPVRAAGVVCWRLARDGVTPQVLLVHRPLHQDWSWPKGKLARGEQMVECAVRETAEETGLKVVLGRPLPGTRYRLPDGRDKQVAYWAARIVGGRNHPDNRQEVDRVAWLTIDEAAERLTQPGDRGPLAAFEQYARAGTLSTTAVLLIRHATARPRDAWPRADADRPLVANGKRQAMTLASLLQCWRPDLILSSPWKRCLQTMDPYAAASGTRVRTKGGLSEDGARRDPAKARRHLRQLLESSRGGALCTHRPVLPVLLTLLGESAAPEVRELLPDANPYLHPGEVLVAHTTHPAAGPRVVALERQPPR